MNSTGAAFVMRAKSADAFHNTSERFQNRAHGRKFAGAASVVDRKPPADPSR
jgi:hypothetical protein